MREREREGETDTGTNTDRDTDRQKESDREICTPVLCAAADQTGHGCGRPDTV